MDRQKKLEVLSNLINSTKKKDLSQIELTMLAKLPDSISFEKRILKLINKVEKVTYRYINTETIKINSIKFQNSQKLLIENDMAWTNKINEFVYIVRNPTGKDRIKNVTPKNFNQSTYLDQAIRENTFWVLQGEKVYRSVNCLYCYYTSFDYSVNLDRKIPYYFEQIQRRSFKQEKGIEQKLVYTTSEYFKTLTPEEKMAMVLVAKCNRQTIRAVLGS